MGDFNMRFAEDWNQKNLTKEMKENDKLLNKLIDKCRLIAGNFIEARNNKLFYSQMIIS